MYYLLNCSYMSVRICSTVATIPDYWYGMCGCTGNMYLLTVEWCSLGDYLHARKIVQLGFIAFTCTQ